MTRQLARSPYMAGEAFTAADISVTYALDLAQFHAGGVTLGDTALAYLARMRGRPAYLRSLDVCQATKRARAAAAP